LSPMFEIVNRLHAELNSIVEIPDVQQRVAKISMVSLSTRRGPAATWSSRRQLHFESRAK